MKQISTALRFGLLAAAAAGILSCKKTSGTGPATVRQWTIDTATYTPTTVGTAGTMLYASDSAGVIAFRFAALPTSGGTYTVGDPAKGPDKVSIEARAGDDFAGVDGVVKVDVHNGKISVDAEDVWMLKVPMFADSARLSAHLTEQ